MHCLKKFSRPSQSHKMHLFFRPKWQNSILLLVSSSPFHMPEAWLTEVPLSVGTSPYESLLGGPPPGWGTRFYFLKNVYQYLTKPSRRCHSWVCLTSLLISSGLGLTIIQDILLMALSSELCDVLRDTGIYKLYIYEQNSCLVLLNLSTLRGM